MRKNHAKTVSAILFAIYLVLLTWLILFKMQTDLNMALSINSRSINWVPFAGAVIVNGRIYLSEIFWNIACFAPVGIYLSILADRWTLPQKVALIAALSFCYELLQYLFAIGASDITDLLMNTLGGLLGIDAFALLRKAAGNRAVLLINFLAAACTACLIALACILYVSNRQMAV